MNYLTNTLNNYSLSQNFTVSPLLLSKISLLIEPKTDIVLDIGAGKGAITELLTSKFKQVVAIEPDLQLSKGLREHFQRKIVVETKEFSSNDIPNEKFSVVANIPFRNTAYILNTLLQTPNFTYGLIIMQKEAADKFAGQQIDAKRTLLSSQYEVGFTFDVVIHCKPTDFRPVPKVSIVVMEMKQREASLVGASEKAQYNDFLAYSFNKSVPIIKRAFANLSDNNLASRVVSSLTTQELLKLYDLTKNYASVYRGYAVKINAEKNTVQKVFRTRNDHNWRSAN